MSWTTEIERLRGPILVLGASGFVGANLFRRIASVRQDVYGTVSKFPAWRLEGLPEDRILPVDLLVPYHVSELIRKVQPQTIFDCVAYGAYSFQKDPQLIHQTNFLRIVHLLEELAKRGPCTYLHAGSSSEYGLRANRPREDEPLFPNSHYAVSKGAVAGLLHYFGKVRGFPCANLRLYSVYGPYEDSARLIPNLVMQGLQGAFPPFTSPKDSRDFLYVDDACAAFTRIATGLGEEHFGGSFNIGTGVKTTLEELAGAARRLFALTGEPQFKTYDSHAWDVEDWCADPSRAKAAFGWSAETSLEEGLRKTADWCRRLPSREAYRLNSKKFSAQAKNSASVVVACQEVTPAGLSARHAELTAVLATSLPDYEIIFVIDGANPELEESVRLLSAQDRHVLSVVHTRPFGFQAALRSGMELAGKEACVVMGSSAEDSPALLPRFLEQWRAGADVVFVQQRPEDLAFPARALRSLFYKVLGRFSYVPIPENATDYSLVDKRVMKVILSFPERDFYMRGLRAFTGFTQVGIDDPSPAARRKKPLSLSWAWARSSILSYSRTPLNVLTLSGTALFLLSLVLVAAQILIRFLDPAATPKGISTLLICVVFFGSFNLFCIGLLGEYVGKIFEEVKNRPHFIRRTIISAGEAHVASDGVRALRRGPE